MSKFDELMKSSSETYEPRSDFVDKTMKKIVRQKTAPRWYIRRWMPALAGVAVAILIVGVIAWPKNQTSTIVNRAKDTNMSQATASPSVSPAAIAAETVDTQMDTIQQTLYQASSDQSNADSAINDVSQQINVLAD